MARTGMYHIHAARTEGALVDRYFGGSIMGRRMGRYVLPKAVRITERASWTVARASKVDADCWRAWDLGFELVWRVMSARFLEKNKRRDSSMGWNTIRARREP